jgi:hypothetical protein
MSGNRQKVNALVPSWTRTMMPRPFIPQPSHFPDWDIVALTQSRISDTSALIYQTLRLQNRWPLSWTSDHLLLQITNVLPFKNADNLVACRRNETVRRFSHAKYIKSTPFPCVVWFRLFTSFEEWQRHITKRQKSCNTTVLMEQKNFVWPLIASVCSITSRLEPFCS